MKEKNRRSGVTESQRPAYLPQGQFAPRAVADGGGPAVRNAHHEIQQSRMDAKRFRADNNAGNDQAAKALRAMLRGEVSRPRLSSLLSIWSTKVNRE